MWPRSWSLSFLWWMNQVRRSSPRLRKTWWNSSSNTAWWCDLFTALWELQKSQQKKKHQYQWWRIIISFIVSASQVVQHCVSCLSAIVNKVTHNYKFVWACFNRFYGKNCEYASRFSTQTKQFRQLRFLLLVILSKLVCIWNFASRKCSYFAGFVRVLEILENFNKGFSKFGKFKISV